MKDPMTFSDDRLRTLIRRMDRGEIAKHEAAQVMTEHQVDFERFHRIGDEVDREANDTWTTWDTKLCVPIALTCLAIQLACLVLVLVREMRGG